jgi:carboxylesterase type B
MMDYWAQFVKTGNPNLTSAPDWAAYTPKDQFTQILDSTIVSQAHPVSDICAVLWAHRQQ